MGLLDALFPQSDGGGLLDFLKRNAMSQDAPSGLPSDQAQYGAGPPLSLQPPTAYQPGQVQSAPLPPTQNGAPPAGVPMMPPPVIPAAPPPGMPPGAASPPPPAMAAPRPEQPNFFNRAADALGSISRGGSMLGAVRGQFDDPRSQAATQSNLTARALVAKGVDPQIAIAAVQPGNTELLKQLVDRHFGPPKAPTTIGHGWVWNAQMNKYEQVYPDEDKIPAGFAKGDDGNMHFIPGGPADPAYLRTAAAQKKDPNAPLIIGRGGEIIARNPDGSPALNPDGSVKVLHKNESGPEPMDPDSLEVLARREIGGDFSGRKNLGRGAQGASDLKSITQKSTEILTHEMGMTPAQAAQHLMQKQQEYAAQGQGLNAEARTTGVREANLNLILKATDAAIPAALEASEKVARTGWVPVNKIIQGGQVMASNPELKQFGMANLQLAEHWARAMNPTGVMREADRDLALHFLSTADSKETYRSMVGQLRTQIERERDAVKASRGMTNLPGESTSPSPSTPRAAAPPVKVDGYTIQAH